MALLGFKKQFIPDILSGKKQQTIRAFRKYPIERSERLYLYTALRTKHCKKIGEAITKGSDVIFICKKEIILPEAILTETRELNRFAKQDGFKSWEEMRQFWIDTHGLPFRGILIKWHSFKPA